MTPMAKTTLSPRYTAKYSRNMPCCVPQESALRTPLPCASKWRRARKARPCPAIRLLRTDRFSQFSVLLGRDACASSFFAGDFRYTDLVPPSQSTICQSAKVLTENWELRTVFSND